MITAQEAYIAIVDAAKTRVRAHVRKGHPVRAYEREVVYVKRSDIEQVKGWGTERWWKHKGTIEVMPGEPVTKFELPLLLWHVSTNVNAVLQSGKLKWMGDTKTGGLGGGSSMAHRGISLTYSRDDAILIQRELLRMGELARGGRPIREMIERYASEDSRYYRKDFMPAVESAFGTYAKGKDEPSYRFDIFNAYLYQRQKLGGPEDPIILGRPPDFTRLHPMNVGIFAVRRADIPNDALIMKHPIGGGALHEIRVYSEIPVRGSHTIRRSKYWSNPLRLTACGTSV